MSQGEIIQSDGGSAGVFADSAAPKEARRLPATLSLPVRLLFLAATLIAAGIVWYSNGFLTQQYTENTRNRAELRIALYAGNLISELQRNSVVPLLLSRDPNLIDALTEDDYLFSTQRLISFRDEIGAAAIMLLDEEGRAVASTRRELLGTLYRSQPFFVDALRSTETTFNITSNEVGLHAFTYSRKIEAAGRLIGVIVVEVDLAKFEESWSGISDAVMVTDASGEILISTEPLWRGLKEADAVAALAPPGAIERALDRTNNWTAINPDGLFAGDDVIRQEIRIPFQGWRVVSFTTYASVREAVNGILALEIMAFAVLMALAFYLISRRATYQSREARAESAELRVLNEALSREIAERQKAEAHLQVAEQTLAQSSKLAALGEMSAAVSHELNQPLAAMKTYLAGAKLLLQRRRPEEALSSFQRIDDLIERMGAITRQLKSYARKGGEAFEPVDLRDCVSSALSMMEPQLKRRHVDITRKMPRAPVRVMLDRVRMEQVLINLFRNAMDATKQVEQPEIEIIVTAGDLAHLMVRDNGPGVRDLEQLFEPFYTTKAPGDGVGLGLAISSGFVSEFGGRLTARNAPEGGAVFDVELPIYQKSEEKPGKEAAE
ncbi:MAG: two-component system sensor histidine kinase [Rhodobacterales bacterium]|nr:MAG: two-component system sensor histidine kinase [Rhodobacterales bacterium]